MSKSLFPSQKQFWSEIVPRISSAVEARREALVEAIGIYTMYGPKDQYFTGKDEIEQCLSELVKHMVLAMAYELDAREFATESAATRPVGRPRNHMIRYLGPQLVEMFHRYSDGGGRHSVLTSIDGRLAQQEAGPVFAFASVLIAAFNEVMLEALHLRALSAARVVRYGLAARSHASFAPEY